jgi:hypothetical protein
MSTLSQFYGGGGGSVPSQYKLVEFLLIGGGGAAENNDANSGGGGAGEMIEAYNFVVKNGKTYTIGIGGGGATSPVSGIGNNSTFGNITAFGGGGGGNSTFGSRPTLGGSSGGNTSPSSLPTGDVRSRYNIISNTFGEISTITSFASKGHKEGGGGAGGSGAISPPWISNGRDNSITGISSTYAKGGLDAIATANTGNGGGAIGPANPSPTANGGSGVFIIRWPTAYPAASSVSGNTPTPAQPGYHVYRWNSGPGSITF